MPPSSQVFGGAVIGAIAAVLWFVVVLRALQPHFSSIESWPVCKALLIHVRCMRASCHFASFTSFVQDAWEVEHVLQIEYKAVMSAKAQLRKQH